MKSEEARRKPARLFIPDNDGSEFLSFQKYSRWYAEMEAHRDAEQKSHDPDLNPSSDSTVASAPAPELDAAIGSVVRTYARGVAWQKRRDQRKAKFAEDIFHQFDALPFEGPHDFVQRKTFKEALREIVSDYVRDPYCASHLRSDKRPMLELVPEALDWKARRSLGLLRTLAEQGNPTALERLAEIVIPLVKVLNEQARQNPAPLRSVAQKSPFWPVLKSEHKDFDEDAQKLLKTLGVGQEFPLRLVEEARWTARDPIGRWAIHLCRLVETMQEGWCADDKESAPWEERLLQLQPFSRETWGDWWEIAEWILKREFIDVVDIPELEMTVKAGKSRKSPGVIRKRILQALKEKFRSMAGGNKI